MRELALFAGAGGGILGGVLLGWRTVCAVEINAFCARRLMQRQNEGHLPPFPVWDDVCSFDGRPWRGVVDVVSGGFPCQDISAANSNGAGIDGERSGLWREFARIVRDIRPQYILVENSPNLTARGLGRVLGDLAAMGFDAQWGVLSAAAYGAWHRRERMWIVAADAHGVGLREQQGWVGREGRSCETVVAVDGASRVVADAACNGWGEGRSRRSIGGREGQAEQALPPAETQERGDGARATWWDVEPGLVPAVLEAHGRRWGV